MFAGDIMTTNVITVRPDTAVKEIARLLTENRISGMPVLDDAGALVGIVTEGDLVHRVLGDHEEKRPGWIAMLAGTSDTAQQYRKAHGQTAADVMTRGAITVTPYTPVEDVARVLEERGIKRVPVVKDGKLVGVVSRANVVKTFAERKDASPRYKLSDSTIRVQILDEIGAHQWANASYVNITVDDGGVQCWGFVPDDEARRAVVLAATNVAGVGTVTDNLRILQIPLGYC